MNEDDALTRMRMSDLEKPNPLSGMDWSELTSRISNDSRAREAALKRSAVATFKATYVTIRTNNLALDHRSAIELTKMIYREADTLTYEDTV